MKGRGVVPKHITLLGTESKTYPVLRLTSSFQRFPHSHSCALRPHLQKEVSITIRWEDCSVTFSSLRYCIFSFYACICQSTYLFPLLFQFYITQRTCVFTCECGATVLRGMVIQIRRDKCSGKDAWDLHHSVLQCVSIHPKGVPLNRTERNGIVHFCSHLPPSICIGCHPCSIHAIHQTEQEWGRNPMVAVGPTLLACVGPKSLVCIQGCVCWGRDAFSWRSEHMTHKK